ncbi:MAG: LEA type 2 family protein [Proteobacteria bacterium]|nr:LEA type 2 family protein [Pseudomonadota bacterium]
MLRVLTLIFTLSLLSACAGMAAKEDQVKVNLSSMKMIESTLLEQRFAVNIRVQNRSQSAMNIKGLSFDLTLNGKDFASGVSNKGLVIEPLSEALLAVDITSTLFGLIRQFQSMQKLETEPFSYELSGTLHLNNKMFGQRFSEKGEIDLKGFTKQTATQ